MEQHNGRFVGACYRCKCDMWLPLDLYNAAKHSTRIAFHCAYGHEQIFSEAESEESKLRRERDLLKQRIAMKDDQIADQAKTIAALNATKAKTVRDLKRLEKGVCPCCARSFVNLQRHMKTKHADYGKGLQ